MKKKSFYYSLYLNFISLVICACCILFSIIIKKFLVTSIFLTIIVILEMSLNIVNYKNFLNEKSLTNK